MPDLPDDYKPLDPGRINAVDPVERAYWRRELACNDDELSRALAEVGEHVAEVRAALAAMRHPH